MHGFDDAWKELFETFLSEKGWEGENFFQGKEKRAFKIFLNRKFGST